MTGNDSREEVIKSVRQRLAQCVSQFDIFRLLREITETFGFKYFFVTKIAQSTTLSEAIVITSAPSDLVQAYEIGGHFSDQQLSSRMREAVAPTEVRMEVSVLAEQTDHQAAGNLDATTYDFNCCFIIPVYDPEQGALTVCFLGKHEPMTMSEMADLTLLGHFTHDRLREVSAKPAKADCPLTERERECLVWTSAGKTSNEIAGILNLSEHTVNHYLNNAARKLGAVNRTQAVAYAMRQGFVE